MTEIYMVDGPKAGEFMELRDYPPPEFINVMVPVDFFSYKDPYQNPPKNYVTYTRYRVVTNRLRLDGSYGKGFVYAVSKESVDRMCQMFNWIQEEADHAGPYHV